MIQLGTKVKIKQATYYGGWSASQWTGTIVQFSDKLIELETPEGNVIINMQHIWSIEEIKE